MAEKFKQMASHAMAGSPAGIVAMMDSLKMIKISELKTLRELETWMSAVDTAIQRNKECAPEATRTLKWTWKVLSVTHGGDVFCDQGCPSTMDQLEEFVRNRRFPKAKLQTAEGYMSYYTGGLFTIETDATSSKKSSKFFEKGQASQAPALKWRMTAYVTRSLFQMYVAEKYIVKKLQNGDFEDWADFKTKILLWANIDEIAHTWKRPSELWDTIREVVNSAKVSPGKFMLNVQRLESTVRAYALEKDTKLNVYEGDEEVSKATDDKVNPMLWLVIEGIAAIGLDKEKCRVIEDKFVEAEQDLNPSTLASKKHQWQKLVQGECRKSKVVGAVRQVRESGELDYCNDSDLDDLFETACDDAEIIAAVRIERAGGNKVWPRKFEQRPGRFKNLKKTFAEPYEAGGNNRRQRQQVVGPGKFKVFADVCREWLNDKDMLRKDLHSFPKCPNKPRTERKSSGVKGAWPRRKINAVSNKQEPYGELTEQDRQSIHSYTESQRGAHLPQ